jgi:hypothetical protein
MNGSAVFLCGVAKCVARDREQVWAEHPSSLPSCSIRQAKPRSQCYEHLHTNGQSYVPLHWCVPMQIASQATTQCLRLISTPQKYSKINNSAWPWLGTTAQQRRASCKGKTSSYSKRPSATLKRHRHHHNAAAKFHHEFATNDGQESAEVAHSAKQILSYVRILHRNEEQSFVPSTGRQSGRGCQASSKTATTTYSRDVSQCHTWDLRRKGRTAW